MFAPKAVLFAILAGGNAMWLAAGLFDRKIWIPTRFAPQRTNYRDSEPFSYWFDIILVAAMQVVLVWAAFRAQFPPA